jgi:predicted AAA+ superfamily ATPase
MKAIRTRDLRKLRYLRDTDKREVDFVVLEDEKPLFAVECKAGEKAKGCEGAQKRKRLAESG